MGNVSSEVDKFPRANMRKRLDAGKVCVFQIKDRQLRTEKKPNRQLHDTLKHGRKEGLAVRNEKAGTGPSTISLAPKVWLRCGPPYRRICEEVVRRR